MDRGPAADRLRDRLDAGGAAVTPETELERLFRAAADEYAEQLKRIPAPVGPEPMTEESE